MREFLDGVGELGRGFRFWASSPRLMLLGALPALLVAVVWTGLLGWLVVSLGRVAAALTPFADGWVDPWPTAARVAVGIAVLVAALLVAAVSFAAVTLAVGGPFYEQISADTERRLGQAPTGGPGVWRGLWRGVVDGARLLVASLGVGVLAFAIGLVPVVGTVLAIGVGAVLGGRLLAVELTGTAFDARGYTLAQRRALLAGHRARVAGFGAAVWLLLLVPLVAVVAMPAAVSGATVLARRVLDAAEPTVEPTAEPTVDPISGPTSSR